MHVEYKITKEITNKKLENKELKISLTDELNFDRDKYSENSIVSSGRIATDKFHFNFTDNINYDKKSITDSEDNFRKDSNLKYPPLYPKKTSSLFNKLKKANEKVLSHEIEDKKFNKPSMNNNSNSLNNTTIPTPINASNALDYEIIDLTKFDNINDSNYAFYKDSFCEAFFIAGLPMKKAKIIIDCEHLIPQCKHKICTQLPGYKPDILKKFKMGELSIENLETGNGRSSNCNSIIHLNNSPQTTLAKFDLTQTTTNLCFPHGIKICYHLNEDEIYPAQNFMTITTNEAGRHHYIYIYNYYQKISLIDFKSKYDIDPVTDYNRYNKNILNILEKLNDNSLSSKEISRWEERYQEVYLLSCELASRDYIYIPQCACLVSKLPYTKQMEKSIEGIIKMSVDSNLSYEEVNKFLLNLIYEIPIPPPNKKLLFYIPYSTVPLEITGKSYKDLPICSYNLSILFNYFKAEAIVNIYYLILFEQKLLFVYDDYQILTEISQAFINLIYPMEWIHTYISVISEEMIKYIKSFMPFIMGVDSTLFNYLVKNEEFDEENNVYIIFINSYRKSIIETSNTYVKRKKMSSKNLMKNLPDIPEETSKDVVKNVQNLMKIFNENYEPKKKSSGMHTPNITFTPNDNSNTNSVQKSENYISLRKIDKKFKVIFMKLIALLIGDYKKYVSYIDDTNYFNSECFLQSRPESYIKFYKELIDTGIFKNFLTNIKDNSYLYFDKICNRQINLILSKSNYRKLKSKTSTNVVAKSLLNSDSKSNRPLMRSNSIREEKRIVEKPRRNESAVRLHSNVSKNIHSRDFFQSPKPTIKDADPFLKSNNVINLTPTKGLYSYSNEMNSDTNSVNDNKSVEHSESYLIMPYFLNSQIKSVIPIEDIITEKFKYSTEKINNLNNLIKKRIFPVEIQKEFLVEKIPRKFRNYIIPGHEINPYLVAENIKLSRASIDELNTSAHSIAFSHDNMKEMINDFLKNIISTENFSKIDKLALSNILTTKYGRSYFSKILLQNKFRENRSQILNENGFEELFHMIFNCLVTCENDPVYFDDAIRITKSSFFYYKLVKGKDQVFIYQEITNKTQPFPIWLNNEFWMKWFKNECEERQNELNNIEDFYFFILSEIGTYMNNLNIDLKFILSCIIDNIATDVIKNDTSLINDLEKTIKKQKEFLSKENEFD